MAEMSARPPHISAQAEGTARGNKPITLERQASFDKFEPTIFNISRVSKAFSW